jgi:uroporphyrinogen decarboxylase
LRAHLGLSDTPFKIFDLYQMLAEIEQTVADRFGADCVPLNRAAVAFGIPNTDFKPYALRDGTPVLVPGGFNPITDSSGDLLIERDGQPIAQMPHDGFYFDRLEKYPGAAHPDLRSWRPPKIAPADLDHYAHHAQALFTETDKAIIAAMGPPYELFNGIGQGGFEDWMLTFASEDQYVEDLYGLLVDTWIDNLIAFYQAVGDRVHIIQICDDFGTQHGPFLSVEMFREKLLPHYRRGLDWIHRHTPWKVMLHSDGAIFPLLDSIVEIGVDILNPVQTTAPGMIPAKLKQRFGDKLVFWGGSCDCQNALNQAIPSQIAAEVQQNLEIFSPNSGYVFASVHNIQANVPPQNIVALFDTVRSFTSTHSSPVLSLPA